MYMWIKRVIGSWIFHGEVVYTMGFGSSTPNLILAHATLSFPFSPNLKRLRRTNKEIRKAEIWIETTEFYVSVSKKGNGSGSSCWNVDSAIQWINYYRVEKYQPRSQGSLLPREPWERDGISIRKNDCAILWIETCPVDSVIHLLNNRGQDDRIECRTKERGSRLFPLPIVLRSGEASAEKKKNLAIFFASSSVAGV